MFKLTLCSIYPQTLRAIPPPSLTSKIGPFCALWTQKSVFGTQKSELLVPFGLPWAPLGLPFGLPWAPLGLSLSTSERQSRKSKKKVSLPAGKGSPIFVVFFTFFFLMVFFSKDIFQTRFFIDFRKLEDPSKPSKSSKTMGGLHEIKVSQKSKKPSLKKHFNQISEPF